MSKPMTFFEKVWNDHIIADLGEGTALLGIDRGDQAAAKVFRQRFRHTVRIPG